jgi:hypothetical protein
MTIVIGKSDLAHYLSIVSIEIRLTFSGWSVPCFLSCRKPHFACINIVAFPDCKIFIEVIIGGSKRYPVERLMVLNKP